MAPHIFNLGSGWRSTRYFTPPPLYSRGLATSTHWTGRGLGGFQSQLWPCGESKTFCPYWERTRLLRPFTRRLVALWKRHASSLPVVLVSVFTLTVPSHFSVLCKSDLLQRGCQPCIPNVVFQDCLLHRIFHINGEVLFGTSKDHVE
jgi:hypothetical protein